MTVLIDASPLQSEHRYRGVGTYVRELIPQLIALDPERFVFAAARRDLDTLDPNIRDRTVTGRRGHRPAQMYWLYNEWFLRRAVRASRPDAFHATDFNGLIPGSGIPVVTTLYDCTPLKEGLSHPGLSGRLSDLRWWEYYYHKLPRASHIIAISEYARQDAVRLLGIPEDRITVIPLGVDSHRFQPGKGAGRFGSEPPYFLFVGGRAPSKNLDRVMEAFSNAAAETGDTYLYIAGPQNSDDRAWLTETTTRLGTHRRVRHLGFVDGNDLPSLYANARAFVFPSLEEGFGLPILEAMACGAPVITSNRSVMPEVAGSAAVLIDPTDSSELARALRELHLDAALRADLTRRGLARAQGFSWSRVARQTIAVYDWVLARQF